MVSPSPRTRRAETTTTTTTTRNCSGVCPQQYGRPLLVQGRSPIGHSNLSRCLGNSTNYLSSNCCYSSHGPNDDSTRGAALYLSTGRTVANNESSSCGSIHPCIGGRTRRNWGRRRRRRSRRCGSFSILLSEATLGGIQESLSLVLVVVVVVSSSLYHQAGGMPPRRRTRRSRPFLIVISLRRADVLD